MVAAAGDELRVRIDGTSWRVRPADGTTVLAGDRVRVVDRDNLDLVVTPTDTPATPVPEERQ